MIDGWLTLTLRFRLILLSANCRTADEHKFGPRLVVEVICLGGNRENFIRGLSQSAPIGLAAPAAAAEAGPERFWNVRLHRALHSAPLSRKLEHLTPTDGYFGRAHKILNAPRGIKRMTIERHHKPDFASAA